MVLITMSPTIHCNLRVIFEILGTFHVTLVTLKKGKFGRLDLYRTYDDPKARGTLVD